MQPSPDPAALARIRAALQDELRRQPPVRSWRKEAALLSMVLLGLPLLTLAVTSALHAYDVEVVKGRVVGLGLLLATAALGTWAAIAPRRRAWRYTAIGLGAASAITLVIERTLRAPSPPTQPPWVCTGGHLAAAIVPLLVASYFLKSSAPHRTKAFVAGLAVGTFGAFVGELGCEQGALHVVLFHYSAWAAVVAFVTVLSSRWKPRSFAP